MTGGLTNPLYKSQVFFFPIVFEFAGWRSWGAVWGACEEGHLLKAHSQRVKVGESFLLIFMGKLL